jgi:hypothetical protein
MKDHHCSKWGRLLLLLLQAARKSQKQLAQQVAQLQAQPPQAAPAQQSAAAPPAGTLGPAAAAEGSMSAQPQQQQQQQSTDAGAGPLTAHPAAAEALQPSRRCSNSRSIKRITSSEDGGSAVEEAWQTDSVLADLAGSSAGCQAPDQLLCLSAEQLAVLSSRQGRAQAQLELMQGQLQKQQVSSVYRCSWCC